MQRLKEQCLLCLVDRYGKDYPADCDESKKIAYTQAFFKILSEANSKEGAPEIVEKIDLLKIEMFGAKRDFTEIKKHFNNLILSLEESVYENIQNSEKPLETAIKYAIRGNFIDYGAMKSVDEDKLNELIDKAREVELDKTELEMLYKDLASAKNMVLLTDNCGEIVFDTILIKIIKNMFPEIVIDIITRGMPVLNDATPDDAKQVGLDKLVSVTGNGTAIGGTCLERISEESRKIIDNADVIISKGMGNFETLRACGKNIYYLFMCKCKMFSDMLNVPLYSTMLVNDLRMK